MMNFFKIKFKIIKMNKTQTKIIKFYYKINKKI